MTSKRTNSNSKPYSIEWENSQIARFDAILTPEPSQLLREQSTEYNFLELKNLVDSAIKQVSILSQNFGFWKQLSDGRKADFVRLLDDMESQFSSMISFDPKQNNAWNLRNNIVLDFKNFYNNFYESFTTPLNAYLGSKAYSEELSSEFGLRAKEELSEISRVKTEIEKIQRDVSQAAQVAGNTATSAHSIYFDEQAKEHARTAKNWLISLMIFTVVSMIIIIIIVLDIAQYIQIENLTSNLDAYLLKLLVIGALLYGIRFIIRNYSANRHLYIVNKHRANTLSSILAFQDGATTETTKDTILLTGISSAYSHQETGFLTTKEGAGSDSSGGLEALQNLMRR